MAKKHRSGKPVPGGRVTAKGVRPSGAASRADDEVQTSGAPRPATTNRPDPAQASQPRSQAGPTRAGHHHGQR